MPSYSGLWDGVYGTPYVAQSTTAQIGTFRKTIAHHFRPRIYSRASFAALMLALSGAAVGGAALAQHKRVKSNANPLGNAQGGLRTIETFDDVNRVTVAADETFLEAMLDLSVQPTTYVVDKSGNGGGGKLGR